MSERADADDVIKELFRDYARSANTRVTVTGKGIDITEMLFETFKAGYLKGYLSPRVGKVINLAIDSDGSFTMTFLKDGTTRELRGHTNPLSVIGSLFAFLTVTAIGK